MQHWKLSRNLRGLLLSAECHNTTSDNISDRFYTIDSYRNRTSELHLRREIAMRSQRNSHHFRRGCNQPAATIRSMSRCQSSLLQITGDHTATDDELPDDHGTVDVDAALLRVQQYYSVFHLHDHRRARRCDRSQILSDPEERKRLRADDPAVLST